MLHAVTMLTQFAEVNSQELDLFAEPARLIFAGYSGSGKSYLLSKLLNKYKHKFAKIILIGSILENVEDVNIERNDDFDPFENPIIGHVLCIYDDVLLSKKHLFNASLLFTKGRHGGHPASKGSYSVVLLTQNLFYSDKHYRTLALNTSGTFLLKQRDFRQIRTYAATFLDKQKVEHFLKLYNTLMNERYSYIFIDYTKPVDSPLALRTNLTDDKGYEIAFKL